MKFCGFHFLLHFNYFNPFQHKWLNWKITFLFIWPFVTILHNLRQLACVYLLSTQSLVLSLSPSHTCTLLSYTIVCVWKWCQLLLQNWHNIKCCIKNVLRIIITHIYLPATTICYRSFWICATLLLPCPCWLHLFTFVHTHISHTSHIRNWLIHF